MHRAERAGASDDPPPRQAVLGDRPLVAIGACTQVELIGQNRFVSGANPAALELEPTSERRPEGSPVGALNIDPATQIQGPIRWRGEKMPLKALLEKFPRVPAPQAPAVAPPAEKPKGS
mgnify:CR=1 FL=1